LLNLLNTNIFLPLSQNMSLVNNKYCEYGQHMKMVCSNSSSTTAYNLGHSFSTLFLCFNISKLFIFNVSVY
jgi:hypothetical protein